MGILNIRKESSKNKLVWNAVKPFQIAPVGMKKMVNETMAQRIIDLLEEHPALRVTIITYLL